MALLSEFDSGEFLRGYIAIFKEKLTNIISQYQAVFGNSLKGTYYSLSFIQIRCFIAFSPRKLRSSSPRWNLIWIT